MRRDGPRRVRENPARAVIHITLAEACDAPPSGPAHRERPSRCTGAIGQAHRRDDATASYAVASSEGIRVDELDQPTGGENAASGSEPDQSWPQ